MAKTLSYLDILPQLITSRAVHGGGFTNRPGGSYRSDATAWATITLQLSGTGNTFLESARSRLAQDQLDDGRLSISPQHDSAYWPTPLAILAWRGSAMHREAQSKAVQFLLRESGVLFGRESNNTMGHDPSIKGWPWIAGTHSWIEPTALSMIAIASCGFGDHARVREASRLLLDRQLPRGGWNYGNTTVFGQELHPDPESTGAALHALKGRVSQSQIQRSLDYLLGRVKELRTPFALGWSLLGLESWGLLPREAHKLVERCLRRQERFGEFETTSLCLLLCSAMAPTGLYTNT